MRDGIAAARDACAGANGARNPACTISGRTSSFHCASSSLYLTQEIRQPSTPISASLPSSSTICSRSHQRVAAVTGDEMRLVSVERLGVQSLIVQPENLQEIAGGLPVALLVDVVVEIILGLLLARAADDVDVDPNPRFAAVRAGHLLEMIDLRLCALEMGAVLEDDEIHVAVARGEILRCRRSAGVHDRRMGLPRRH